MVNVQHLCSQPRNAPMLAAAPQSEVNERGDSGGCFSATERKSLDLSLFTFLNQPQLLSVGSPFVSVFY